MEQIHKMTVKEMWEFCLFQAKGYKILEVVLILGTISAASIAYVNSFLYAKALNALLEGQYQTATVFVVKLVGAVWIISLIAKASGRIFEHYIEPSQEETKKRTAKKAFQMEFEEIEKEQTLEKFRKVQLGERGMEESVASWRKSISILPTVCRWFLRPGLFCCCWCAQIFPKRGSGFSCLQQAACWLFLRRFWHLENGWQKPLENCLWR